MGPATTNRTMFVVARTRAQRPKPPSCNHKIYKFAFLSLASFFFNCLFLSISFSQVQGYERYMVFSICSKLMSCTNTCSGWPVKKLNFGISHHGRSFCKMFLWIRTFSGIPAKIRKSWLTDSEQLEALPSGDWQTWTTRLMAAPRPKPPTIRR